MKSKVFIHQKSGVGIIGDIVLLIKVVLDHVVNETAHQGDVGAGPQAHEQIGLGRRPGEARVHHDELGALVHGLGDPFETDGMVFGRVAADDHDAITVGDIVPVVGHGAPSEGGPQRGHRGRVSEAGLMF